MSVISEWGATIVDQYPNPKLWPSYKSHWKPDVFRFAGLWLTEGIPYAFKARPIAFEFARERLAKRLGESTKSISMTGSARTGYSYSPEKFGANYQPGKSDVDAFLVSDVWFKRLVSDFEVFLAQFRAGTIEPRGPAEAKYFAQNANETPGTIQRGFIDQWRIPYLNQFSHVSALSNSIEAFRRDLNANVGPEERIARVSMRVYRSWERAIGQIGGSLLKSLSEMDPIAK